MAWTGCHQDIPLIYMLFMKLNSFVCQQGTGKGKYVWWCISWYYVSVIKTCRGHTYHKRRKVIFHPCATIATSYNYTYIYMYHNKFLKYRSVNLCNSAIQVWNSQLYLMLMPSYVLLILEWGFSGGKKKSCFQTYLELEICLMLIRFFFLFIWSNLTSCFWNVSFRKLCLEVFSIWEHLSSERLDLSNMFEEAELSLTVFSLPLKSTGRDRSWTGDYAACGRRHLAHAAWFAHIPYLLQSQDGSIPREPA